MNIGILLLHTTELNTSDQSDVVSFANSAESTSWLKGYMYVLYFTGHAFEFY